MCVCVLTKQKANQTAQRNVVIAHLSCFKRFQLNEKHDEWMINALKREKKKRSKLIAA